MDIRIHQKPALVGLKIIDSDIKMSGGSVNLDIKNGESKLKIQGKPGEFKIDSSRCREAIQFYKASSFSKEIRAEAINKSMESIQTRVEQGFMMQDIHKHGFIIHKLSERGAWNGEKQIEVGFKPGPVVKHKKSTFKIDAKIQPVKVKVKPTDLGYEASYGKVEMYLEQKPYFDIEWVGNMLDYIR